GIGREDRLWGADRIRGELLKLDIRVSKRTIQRYLRRARPPRAPGQTWATFLRNHAHEIWACDFLPVTDLLFRPVYAFFVIALGSRRVVHVSVTQHPTDAWVAQQLREATCPGRLVHPRQDPGTLAPGLPLNQTGWTKRPGQPWEMVACCGDGLTSPFPSVGGVRVGLWWPICPSGHARPDGPRRVARPGVSSAAARWPRQRQRGARCRSA